MSLLLVVVALLSMAAGPSQAGVAAAVPMAATPNQLDDDGLAVDGTTTYVVDPAAGVVRATVDVTITHQVPDQAIDGGIRFFYWDDIGIPLLGGARALAATGDGAAVSVRTEATDHPFLSFAIVDLPRRLRYGQTQVLRLTYEIPHSPPRSDNLVRVNEAYAVLIPIPFGDPGGADLRVVVPAAYEVELVGNAIGRTTDSPPGTVTYTGDDLNPDQFSLVMSMHDPDRLTRHQPDGPHDIDVHAWPDDDQWADLVVGQVEEGLPVLEELIGVPWPIEGDLVVQESVSPYLYGYGGWFDPVSHVIEVTDDADAPMVLHELGHAWFGPDLFASRWITEGMAEEFAARTVEAMGDPLLGPDPIDPASPARVLLDSWEQPAFSTPEAMDREEYGYNAAFSVVRAITDEIGVEALARVIQAEHDDLIAYRGDPEVEEWSFAGDWRRFLDLLEEVGGSAEAEALFRAHVIAGDEVPELDQRTEARAALVELAAAGDAWSPPLEVRQSMSFWRFDRALDQMATSHEVLAARDELEAILDPIGVEVPTGLETAYEQAEELEDLTALTAELLELSEDLVDAHDAVRGSQDPLTRIGLLGADAEARLDDALAAFDAADPDATGDAIDDATATVAAAQRQGLLRAGGVLALLLVVAGTVLLVRRYLRRRHERAATRTQAVADLEGLGEAEGLQLADVDLEAGPVAAEVLGQDGGHDPGSLVDEAEGGAGPGPVGGGGVEAVEPLDEGGDVVG